MKKPLPTRKPTADSSALNCKLSTARNKPKYPNTLATASDRTSRLKPSSKKLPELVRSVTEIVKKPVRVFFQDEVRLGKICQVRKVGLPKRERSVVEAHLVKALRWVEANTAWVKSFAYFPYIQHAI